jgi:hypothetical protein
MNYLLILLICWSCFFVILAPALNPYQMVRLRQCMSNSARLKELGLSDREYSRVWAQDVAGHDKNQSEGVQSDKYQSGDSESEYDPLQDDNGEGGSIDNDNAKVLVRPSCQVLLFLFLIQYNSLKLC